MHCNTQHFSIFRLSRDRDFILIPPECRRPGAWNLKKQRLFLDSLFNGYDSPKLYFRDLRKNKKGAHNYALIDGRQRLQCVWDFMDGKISLAKNFTLKTESAFARKQTPLPKGGDFFGDLSEYWREEFKSTMLDAALISEADAEDVNEIMSRVNRGESLKHAPAKSRAA